MEENAGSWDTVFGSCLYMLFLRGQQSLPEVPPHFSPGMLDLQTLGRLHAAACPIGAMLSAQHGELFFSFVVFDTTLYFCCFGLVSATVCFLESTTLCK